jgi:hypothetical protein
MIMKKSLVILAILMTAVPAMATVTLTATQEAMPSPCTVTGLVDISYVNTEPNYVRAFALDITVDGDGNITDINNYFVGECNSTKKGYGIFPGTIAINASGVVTSYGTPVAPAADPCALAGLGHKGITIEMGSLYTGSLHPANSGLLCKLYVSTSAGCNLHVALNAKRGGVVLENPALTASVSLPATLSVVACAGTTTPVCLGDFDLDGWITTDDLSTMMGQMRAAGVANDYSFQCPDAPAICPGDFDGDGWVTTDDLSTMMGEMRAAGVLNDYSFQCP